MKISEKQLMQLINIATQCCIPNANFDENYKKEISKFLHLIHAQQSTELKEVTDEQR